MIQSPEDVAVDHCRALGYALRHLLQTLERTDLAWTMKTSAEKGRIYDDAVEDAHAAIKNAPFWVFMDLTGGDDD
jgi:hypothetical protein